MFFDETSDPLRFAVQADQLGYWGNAAATYERLIELGGEQGETARHLLRGLHKRMLRRENRNVVWQSALEENSFVDHCFRRIPRTCAPAQTLSVGKIILTLQAVGSETPGEEAVRLCKDLYDSALSVVIFLQDEWGRYGPELIDRMSRYADLIVTSYYSEHLRGNGKVLQLPLGWCDAEFPVLSKEARRKTTDERIHLWAFLGDIKKSSRREMIQVMRQVEGGYEHIISAWASADSLSTQDYRRILESSVFVPCPRGWANLNSYRVWESLECGCIPILESFAHFDYFTRLLGPHPMPTVDDWSKAKPLIDSLIAGGEVEALRLKCAAWWEDYKNKVAIRIEEVLADL